MPSPSVLLARSLTGLRDPDKLHSLHELAPGGTAVPPNSGVYAWYFTRRPPQVPASDCRYRGLHLLYVGIAPSTARSKSTIQRRLTDHAKDDASRSTLRRSVGSLLGFIKHAKRQSFWFAEKEGELSAWLRDNAMVCWVDCPQPWLVEAGLVGELHPHLNLIHNRDGRFYHTLQACRRMPNSGKSHSQ